jgi:Spy/CpxP family protein refolding chaperone
MKHRIGLTLGLAIMAGVLSIPTIALSADKQPARAASVERRAAVRDRMQELSAELNLTEAQKEKLRPIIREEMGKMQELRNDATLSRQGKAQKLRALRQEMEPKIKAILTEEQFAKWREKRKEMRRSCAEARKRSGNK